MSRRRTRGVPVLVLGLGTVVAANAAADEAFNLDLYRTVVKTESVLLVLSQAPQPIFTPTTVSCPGSGTCTVRVELAAEYGSAYMSRAFVRIDGSPASPNVLGGALVIGSGTGLPDPRTFSWVSTELAPGAHTVEVEAALLSAGGGEVTGSIRQRTLTISVFRELALEFLAQPPEEPPAMKKREGPPGPK